MKSKSIILKQKYNGMPKESDYEIIEENLPELKNGEFLAEALYISVDPYMRLYVSNIGKPIIGEQIAKIIDSKNENFLVGKLVIGEFGWRTRTIANEKRRSFSPLPPRILPDYGDLPKSLALGILGMTGNTAYFCFLNVCKPVAGNTVVISSGAGAVGSHVGQIAKIKGCRAVGITSSNEKGSWLVNDLGFDAFVNYKSDNFENELAEATPDGIDCYFDNVGGEISSIVLTKMNKFGRVAICGSISTYNDDNESEAATEIQTAVKTNHLRVEGFSVFSYSEKWNEGIEQNLQWIKEGKLKYRETVTLGFENTPKAFIGMMSGKCVGKAIIKVEN